MSQPTARTDIEALLRWYIEAGVDEAIGETPLDRYAASAAMVASRVPSASPAAPALPAAPPRERPPSRETPVVAPARVPLESPQLVEDARTAAAEADGILPDDFYASTNLETFVRVSGAWTMVSDQGMDCAVVLRAEGPTCVKQRKVRAGERVLVRGPGIRVRPIERSRDWSVFGFMSNDVSAEVNKGIAIAGVAREMRRAREAGERIVAVVGPAVVHSGGDAAFARLVRDGWIDVLLSGNAFAVHDLEKAILKTSLGVCQMSGRGVEGGSRNHLFAINAVNRAGGVRAAVESGMVTAVS